METEDLTPEQLYSAFWPHVNYVVRLDERLDELGFKETEPLQREVIAAPQRDAGT